MRARGPSRNESGKPGDGPPNILHPRWPVADAQTQREFRAVRSHDRPQPPERLSDSRERAARAGAVIGPLYVRFAPIASEIRHRSETTRSADCVAKVTAEKL